MFIKNNCNLIAFRVSLNMDLSLFDPEPVLREHRLRVTPVRCHVLQLMYGQPGAMTHQQVLDELNASGYELDRVTVYRTLNTLTDSGILHRITGIDRTFSYAFKRQTDNENQVHSGAEHPHFICDRCSVTYCLPDIPAESLPAIPAPAGFELRQTELKLYGVCPDCV